MNLGPCPVLEEQASIVIASPNSELRRQMVTALDAASWLAGEASGGAEALDMLETGEWEAVLFDCRLPDLNVNELVTIIQSNFSGVDVFVKDFETGNLLFPAEAPERPQARDLFGRLSAAPPRTPLDAWKPELVPGIVSQGFCSQAAPLPGMVGASPAMQRVYRLARLVSPRDTTALITGETGTGKELVAEAIHSLSPRSRSPFVAVNCAAIPDALLESEFFGHVRGAFTGAVQSRLGRVQAADGGTLFLDEIGELPLTMQAKLLRFLQGGEIQRLGSNQPLRVDVRVIAATNANLMDRVAGGGFREDLYYRLAVFPIDLEPLRNRPQDILPTAQHFLDAFCRQAGVCRKRIGPQAGYILEQYPWPGNVRELRLVIERAFIFAEESSELRPEHIWLPSARGLAKS